MTNDKRLRLTREEGGHIVADPGPSSSLQIEHPWH